MIAFQGFVWASEEVCTLLSATVVSFIKCKESVFLLECILTRTSTNTLGSLSFLPCMCPTFSSHHLKYDVHQRY